MKLRTCIKDLQVDKVTFYMINLRLPYVNWTGKGLKHPFEVEDIMQSCLEPLNKWNCDKNEFIMFFQLYHTYMKNDISKYWDSGIFYSYWKRKRKRKLTYVFRIVVIYHLTPLSLCSRLFWIYIKLHKPIRNRLWWWLLQTITQAMDCIPMVLRPTQGPQDLRAIKR